MGPLEQVHKCVPMSGRLAFDSFGHMALLAEVAVLLILLIAVLDLDGSRCECDNDFSINKKGRGARCRPCKQVYP